MTIPVGAHLLLFESCQLTQGASRTLLVDLQRNGFEFLDNALYPILTKEVREKPFQEIIDRLPPEEQEALLEYTEFLLSKEYAYWCDADEVTLFPPMDLTWHEPAKITNALVDFDSAPEDLTRYKLLFEDLDALGCENIQFRAYAELPFSFWRDLLSQLQGTILHRVELLIPFVEDPNGIRSLLKDFTRINELVAYNAPGNYDIPTDSDQRLRLTKETVSGPESCGLVSPRLFNLNQEHFFESQRHNTCLNRKLSVDTAGYIKNCPALPQSHGHISKDRATHVATNPEFQKAWNIHKGLISDCQVCEFRHICTDCRAHHGTEMGHQKPAKCTYNPHTITWQ